MDFFDVMFGKKYGAVPFSKNYFDTLFAAKLAQLEIKTLTGTLPLTFRTSETALRSWTIYGNNTPNNYSAEGTLPLTFTTQTAGAASDWSISGNDNVGKNLLEITAETQTIRGVTFTVDKQAGTVTANGRATAEAMFGCLLTLPAGRYLENGCPSGGSDNSYDVYMWDIAASTRTKMWDGTTNTPSDYGRGVSQEVLLTEETQIRYSCRIRNGYDAQNVVFKPMLRLPNTSETFEPYQIGVGERTVNLFDGTFLQGYWAFANGAFTQSNSWITTNKISCEASKAYTFSFGRKSRRYGICWFDANDTFISENDETNTDTSEYRSYTATSPANAAYLVINIAGKSGSEPVTPTDITDMMLVEGNAAPTTFIPYGYEIPILVNTTTQDIYIGDSPLTAGQSVSKTSTGVDIAAIAGSNTITTELYNKPEMSIEGVDYVGVGEPINDSWQIPLTVTHYTDNIFDKDAKNTNKGYEDSTCLMWAGDISSPYLTGNIPEDNNCFVSEKIPVSPNTRYYLTDGIFKNTANGIYSVFLWNRLRMSDYQAFPTEKTFTTGDDTKFIQLCVLKAYADTVMITTQPTETYIPHVEVNNVNVPIDAPLTEGQSVTDTVTISTFEGENVIDTTLTNKPQMTITYKGG